MQRCAVCGDESLQAGDAFCTNCGAFGAARLSFDPPIGSLESRQTVRLLAELRGDGDVDHADLDVVVVNDDGERAVELENLPLASAIADGVRDLATVTRLVRGLEAPVRV